jgi:thiol-disulfide isomerase/thioredoxin
LRNTLVAGVVLGLVVSGLVGVTGYLAFGCPYLPSASSLKSEPAGWSYASVSPWQQEGKPVVYFYGATWCPFCSASSWAIWKALSEFGQISNVPTGYSSNDPAGPYTPEIILANAQFSSTTVAFQVSEDTSGVVGNLVGSTNCYQEAYTAAYSAGSIPFLVVNGVYVHAGTSLVLPSDLSSWANGMDGGASAVQSSVASETGTPWAQVQAPAWWMMAFMAKASGVPVSTLATTYHWSSGTQTAVSNDLLLIS